MDAMPHTPWMLKTWQTMEKAGMPLPVITAMASLRCGDTRARANTRVIRCGANLLCMGEEATWSPWELIAKAPRGETDLILF